MSVLQQRNDELVNLLLPDFQLRYEPNFAWKSAVSAFAALPGLRGLWPMSSFNESGNAYDVSGQGRTLTYNGNPTYNYSSLIPYIDLDGTGDYLSRTDEAGLDITGTESYIATAAQGLTCGGWFYADSAPGADWGLIGKFDSGTNNRSYLLYIDTPGPNYRFGVSVDGTAFTTSGAGASVPTDAWRFVVGRFDPGTATGVYTNGAWQTGGGPASIFNSNADLNIGAFNNGASGRLDGYASLCFLCAAYLSNACIDALFNQTRAMFNQ